MSPAWVTALLALISAVVAAGAWALRTSWRYGTKIVRFLDDFLGVPEHDGIPGRLGIPARLAKVETLIEQVAAETKPNGGTSIKDVLHKTAADVSDMKQSLSRMDGQVSHLTMRVEQFEAERKVRDDD